MKKKAINKLLKRLPKDTEIVIKNGTTLHTGFPIEIKYSSDGYWIVVIDITDKK